jgi:hypothetical protein
MVFICESYKTIVRQYFIIARLTILDTTCDYQRYLLEIEPVCSRRIRRLSQIIADLEKICGVLLKDYLFFFLEENNTYPLDMFY